MQFDISSLLDDIPFAFDPTDLITTLELHKPSHDVHEFTIFVGLLISRLKKCEMADRVFGTGYMVVGFNLRDWSEYSQLC